MTKHTIKNMEDWDSGLKFGILMGCRKELELHFDYMKSVFLGAINEIYDKDLVEQIHENIYTNQRSKDELIRIMNLISHCHREQTQRDEIKKGDKEKDDVE